MFAYPKLDLRDMRREVVDDEIVLAGRSRRLALAGRFPLLERTSPRPRAEETRGGEGR